MHEHPQFAVLLVHDDDELGLALGSPVLSRMVVHEWPLTRTEDVRLADGRRYAYKAQLPPTVEPEYYARSTSPVIPRFRDLGRVGVTAFLATEWIVAPTLHDTDLSESEFVAQAREVVRRIGEIEGNAPAFLDVSTPSALEEAVTITADRLAGLIASKRFANLATDVPSRIAKWGRSAGLVDAATSHIQLTHGDLSPEEVFVTADGFRVIDWQRPVLGPADLDLVSLLRFRRIDPLRYVRPEVVQLSWLILLHWAALAQAEVLPDLPPDIPEGWAQQALPHILNPLRAE
jgi:Phosphotransferase enzyme family